MFNVTSSSERKQDYPPLHILSIPNEVTALFFEKLYPVDCARAAQVCSSWKNIIEGIHTSKQTYSVHDGGAQVTDKTYGFAKVTFRGEVKNRNNYDVMLGNKRLAFPKNPEKPIVFAGSRSFLFEGEEKFIKLTEVDENSTSVFYIYPQTKSAFHCLHSQKPAYIHSGTPLERDLQKLELFKKDHPEITSGAVLRNRHGIALLSYSHPDALFWASPQEEKMQFIKANFKHYRGSGSDAESEDGQLSFQYKTCESSKLNHEEAEFLFFDASK